MDILWRELTIRGFLVPSFQTEFGAAFTELGTLVQNVSLSPHDEQITY